MINKSRRTFILSMYLYTNSKFLPHNSFRMLISNTSNFLLSSFVWPLSCKYSWYEQSFKVFTAADVNYTPWRVYCYAHYSLICEEFLTRTYKAIVNIQNSCKNGK